MESKILYDLHTHTRYSHGKGTVMDNARQAAKLGFTKLGIADHGPGHKFFGIDIDCLDQMRADVMEARKAFPEMEVLMGIEANIINSDGVIDLTPEQQEKFDFIIAGFHYGYFGHQPIRSIGATVGGYLHEAFGLESRALRDFNTEFVTAALYKNNIDILSHPGAKADFDIEEIARACAETDTIMEINNKHGHLTVAELKRVAKYNVKFIIGSDAHYPFTVGDCQKAYKRAVESGIDLERIVNLRKQK